jgi:hypothetical protein
MASETEAAQSPDVKQGASRPTVLDWVAVVGPISLLTGILLYFGYVSSKSYYAYFGVSLSALGLPSTDYVLRSPDTLFKPAVTLVLVLLLVLLAHQILVIVLAGARALTQRAATLALFVLALAAGAVGLDGLFREPRGASSGIALGVAGCLVEYSFWTASRLDVLPRGLGHLYTAGLTLRRGLISALVVAAAFWATTNVAYANGISAARLVERSLPLQSQAVVYSELELQMPGATATRLIGKDTAYRFRYNGLRPLYYADGRWFLLPVRWAHNNGLTVIVLPAGPGRMRVDLAPSPTRTLPQLPTRRGEYAALRLQ